MEINQKENFPDYKDNPLENNELNKYIENVLFFIKSKKNINLENFFLIYTIAFCRKYIKLNSWERDIKSFNLYELKKESKKNLNDKLFSTLDIVDENLLSYIAFFKNNPPRYTVEDILGNIFILSAKKKKRKKLGEHYTRTDLVQFIVNELLLNDDLSDKKVIDPACGSGNFLIYILRETLKNKSFLEQKKIIHNLECNNFLVGIDIQGMPCLITKLRMLMEIVHFHKNVNPYFEFPVYKLDSLLNTHNKIEDGSYDVVITNPPYLRYQLIDIKKRDQLRERYHSATGRFDLYTLFIEKGMKLVKEDGRVIILCSDKFMSAAYGSGVRDYMKENGTLIKALDLSSIYPFEAAVLSAIYYFKKRKLEDDYKTNWLKVYVTNKEIKKRKIGYVTTKDKWRYVTEESEKILNKIMSNSNVTLDDIASRITIGIQTTADDVFCKYMTEEFIYQEQLEKELIYPLLRGRNLNKWSYNWSSKKNTYVLYPYLNKDGNSIPISLSEFPYTSKYLTENKSILKKRSYFKEKKNRMWFEHWTPHSFDLFEGTKILTPDLSSDNKFCLDTNDYFYNGTVYGIKLKKEYTLNDYKYLLGILNSSVINYYHKKINPTHLQSKKFRFQASIMKKYPIVMLNDKDNRYKEVVYFVSQILDEENIENIKEIEYRLNKIVYNIYNLNSVEGNIIESVNNI